MLRRFILKSLAPIAVALGTLFSTPADARQSIERPPQDRRVLQRRIPEAARRGAMAFVRTELLFGTAKADGPPVTEQEFKDFVDQVITRRFPDGLTVLKADGQFKAADGAIVKEQSFVVVLLYPAETQKESSQRIDVIRQLYLNLHAQESVLRVDDPYLVWVSF